MGAAEKADLLGEMDQFAWERGEIALTDEEGNGLVLARQYRKDICKKTLALMDRTRVFQPSLAVQIVKIARMDPGFSEAQQTSLMQALAPLRTTRRIKTTSDWRTIVESLNWAILLRRDISDLIAKADDLVGRLRASSPQANMTEHMAPILDAVAAVPPDLWEVVRKRSIDYMESGGTEVKDGKAVAVVLRAISTFPQGFS